MTIENLETIDLIATDTTRSCTVLVISDHIDWSSPLEHLMVLQEKINAYVEFVESGRLKELRPGSAGMPIEINCYLQHEIPAEVRPIWSQLAEALFSKTGIKLGYRVLSES